MFCVIQVTQLERAMNGLVFVQFSMLIVFCAVLAGLDHYWAVKHSPTTRNWYLKSMNAYPELPPGGFAWAVAVRTHAGNSSAWCIVLLMSWSTSDRWVVAA